MLPQAETGINRPGDEGIATILRYLPYFEDTTNEFYTVTDELSFDPYWYSHRTEAFVRDLYDHGFIQSFDWPNWQKQAVRYYENPDLIARARLSTLVRLLTTHIRKDRFVSGHLAMMIDEGQITAILRRLAVLFRNEQG